MTVADAMLPYRAPRSGATQTNVVVEGRVHDVGPAGLRFTVPDWDGGTHVFGPAPWPMSRVEIEAQHSHPVSHSMGGGPASPVPHDHAETVPQRGDRALVLFAGDGIANPWVVGWWPRG